MRRFAVVVSIFAVAFAVGLLAPTPTADALPPNCQLYCSLNYSYTATLTGHGCDCSYAQADLVAKLNAAVSGECHDYEQIGFCEKTIVYTNPCSCEGACDYRADGYIKYRCRWCLPF